MIFVARVLLYVVVARHHRLCVRFARAHDIRTVLVAMQVALQSLSHASYAWHVMHTRRRNRRQCVFGQRFRSWPRNHEAAVELDVLLDGPSVEEAPGRQVLSSTRRSREEIHSADKIRQHETLQPDTHEPVHE